MEAREKSTTKERKGTHVNIYSSKSRAAGAALQQYLGSSNSAAYATCVNSNSTALVQQHLYMGSSAHQ